jgi:hypothetical protein
MPTVLHFCEFPTATLINVTPNLFPGLFSVTYSAPKDAFLQLFLNKRLSLTPQGTRDSERFLLRIDMIKLQSICCSAVNAPTA